MKGAVPCGTTWTQGLRISTVHGVFHGLRDNQHDNLLQHSTELCKLYLVTQAKTTVHFFDIYDARNAGLQQRAT